MMRHALKLAKIETYFRSGMLDPEDVIATRSEDERDLLALLQIVPDHFFSVAATVIGADFGDAASSWAEPMLIDNVSTTNRCSRAAVYYARHSHFVEIALVEGFRKKASTIFGLMRAMCSHETDRALVDDDDI